MTSLFEPSPGNLSLFKVHCYYGSFELAPRCVMLLEQRGGLQAGAQQRYLQLVSG